MIHEVKNALLVFVLMILCSAAGAQNTGPDLAGRQLIALRTDKRIKADGLLDDEAWLKSNVAGDFVMYNPL